MGNNSSHVKQGRYAILLAALAIIVLIGILDNVTGRDLILSILYLAPVMLATWYAGFWAGVMVSVLSAAAIYISNYVFIPYPHPFIAVSNMLVGLLTFLCVAYLLNQLKQSINRQRQLRMDVERRASELDASIAAIADGIVIVGIDECIQRINAAALAITGLTEEAALHKTLAEYLAPIYIETADGAPIPTADIPAMRALQGERQTGIISHLRRPDERTVWLSISAAPIRLPSGQISGAIVSLTDITELRALQQQQADILRVVSHDLRGPLAVIHGHIQLLASILEERGVDSEVEQSTAAINRGTQQMNAMIQDLVDVTRFEGGQLALELHPVDLHLLVADMLNRVRGSQDVTRIRMDIPPDLPPLAADGNRLERILVNLLTNAAKYSRAGTPIVISARRTDGEAVIMVTDQGMGIAAKDVPHLFERYYRAAGERRAEGIGLGLYIVRLLVEAHSGRVWVESEVGKGSTFFFTIPFAMPS